MFKVVESGRAFTLSLSLSVALLALVGFTGCAGKSGVVNLSSQSPQILKANFLKTDPVTGEQLNLSLSQFDLSDKIVAFGKYDKAYNFNFDYTGIDGKRHTAVGYRGLEVSKVSDSYKLRYINAAHSNSGSRLESYSDFIFKTTAKSDDEIAFEFPNTYSYELYKTLIGTTLDPLDTEQNIEADARQVFSRLGTIVVSVTKDYNLKGEVDTKYPASSIYANFKRLLGEYSWQGDEKLTEIQKANTFSLKVSGTAFPLKVDVYPYRDGSKVQYLSTLQYTLNSKGESTMSKKDIDDAHEQIKRIIND